MREAAAEAAVGDDVHGDDPTVTALETEAAALLGKESAVFCPSGTMANQIAAHIHTEPGQEIILDQDSHIYGNELAGLARHSALQPRPIDASPRGVLTPEAISDKVRSRTINQMETGLVVVENTHNRRGGTAIEPAAIHDATRAAHNTDLPVHLDGARLANAAVAHNATLEQMTTDVDSVMLSLSKGLGAPVGSILAGSSRFIERARRARKFFGGGMRQAGLIAAPARLALDNIDRLKTDHEHARRLADGLDAIPGLDIVPPETNIVLVDTRAIGLETTTFLDACESHGVRGSNFGPYRVRFVTHKDVAHSDIPTAITRIESVISEHALSG